MGAGNGNHRSVHPDGRPVRILLCEDNRISLMAISALLEDEGFELLCARTGAEAIGHADAGFDVLITDIGLPDMDGRELAARLCGGGTEGPVIYLSGLPSNHPDVAGLDNLPGVTYLPKPVDFDDLLRAIRSSTSTGLATDDSPS